MQSILVNPKITKTMIIDMNSYRKFQNINEYILYGDNILEGITLLNDMTLNDDYLVLKMLYMNR